MGTQIFTSCCSVIYLHIVERTILPVFQIHGVEVQGYPLVLPDSDQCPAVGVVRVVLREARASNHAGRICQSGLAVCGRERERFEINKM